MKIRNWKNPIVWLVMLVFSGCVEPYFPEVKESASSFLVVNGFLNANGPTTIQLLRTQNLNETGTPPAEVNATVFVESENGERYGLHETDFGTYVHPNLQMSSDSKYRLYIRTRSGSEYASDYVEVQVTPEIDNVHWRAVGDEVKVYIDTHDPLNNSQYYRWEYEQTWQFRSALPTTLLYERGTIRYRDQRDMPINLCWKTSFSNTIELASSENLSTDVISDYHIFSIPAGSESISIRNSILVRQYTLTRDAYQYWGIVKKNTENIGTLFDPLPSQQHSNIKSLSNPGEVVIGFVSAAFVQEKRIFIDKDELPSEWRPNFASCGTDTLMLSEGNIRDYFEGGYQMPVSEIFPPSGSMYPIGYTYAPRNCVDCTTQGTNVKPAFWE
ncbi:DUF4249 domain-containing protein [Pontibacter sp. HSC-14F20]|uniref:DUF4249 domain-containing protein n=1 Tax=Pontibacter sp. HSC-14F20 TaxID=2864136 RepID=UPI001C73630E|nr:DUF4249 domain-containing protein [Pontibacter sp. HSC-14F20]MBX0334443.1 DUF4249 domain-containing protein [Pontibacter sp. HSC-14F20]